MKTRRLVFAAIIILATLTSGRAHDPGLSIAQGDVRSGTLRITTGFALADARALLPEADRGPAQWRESDFSAAQPSLRKLASRLWEVRGDAAVLPARTDAVKLEPGDNISFVLEFALPPRAASATLEATRLADLPAGHRQFTTVTDASGVTLAQKLLHARDPVLTVPLAAPAPDTVSPGFWAFLKLGIRHIWTGYDHLLFLFALLIVCQTFRSALAIVSSFTIAHSLTLALATLNVVNLPPRLVEPAIAASIVFVGLENLWRRGEASRGRFALTFAFGLIHGFGFASVLRDLGVGAGGRGLAMPLFSFNLGVEVGQIVVASAVLPVVWQLRKTQIFARRGVPIFSGLVAVAGLYWLLQRLFFFGA